VYGVCEICKPNWKKKKRKTPTLDKNVRDGELKKKKRMINFFISVNTFNIKFLKMENNIIIYEKFHTLLIIL